jgi:hypothetical protein
MLLIFAAQRPAEFRPVGRGFFDQLAKCGNGAAHVLFPSCPSGRHLRRRLFAHQNQPAVGALGKLAHLIRLCAQKMEKPLPRCSDCNWCGFAERGSHWARVPALPESAASIGEYKAKVKFIGKYPLRTSGVISGRVGLRQFQIKSSHKR